MLQAAGKVSLAASGLKAPILFHLRGGTKQSQRCDNDLHGKRSRLHLFSSNIDLLWYDILDRPLCRLSRYGGIMDSRSRRKFVLRSIRKTAPGNPFHEKAVSRVNEVIGHRGGTAGRKILI